ncbi:UNVERIFIED_CONTAM: Mediator of RNA polymerase II transcription subunit [Sesamum angustifolium]|uniref:Mediator of RNA polymerase II transcription subunit 25 n=1 Tax=Sesamum angustifolium TaxID=2727405 RepID=A0AAW2M6F3_9LAMI
MSPKQLIVAVEGTAAIGPFWQTIVSDYLDKIIRCFCGNEPTCQKSSTTHFQLSLVMFNGHGSYSACLVQRSGWTRDMDIFFQWLQAIPFAGGGFNDAAIAEGLAEALMMFSSTSGNQNQIVEGQRHCILVAASNPYPLPTPVYRPQPQSPEKSDSTETQPDNCLSDAETLAKSFAQCAISLSVICPKQLPKLRGIYNAGKRNPRAAEPPIDNVKNPHFLILISENFVEARSSLSWSGMTSLASNQNPVKTDVAPFPPISGPPSASGPSANASALVRQPISVGNITPATVKVEPITLTSMTAPAFPQIPSLPRAASQAVPSLQTSSPISMPQDMIPNNANVPDVKPSVTNVTPSLRPVGAPANVRILNDVAQARQALAGGTSTIGLPSIGGTPMLSNMISSGITSSIPPAQTVISSGPSGVTSIAGSLPVSATGQVVHNSAPASSISTASNVSGNASLAMSQPSSTLQGSVSLSQILPGMSQGNHPVTQIVQTGMNMNQNMMSSSGASGMPSGTGTMIPTLGTSQQGQPGMHPVGLNSSNSGTNMPLNQQTSSTIQSAQSKYIKVWEGNLSGQRQGQPVFITRLEGYRSSSASETLAANWPPIMQIVRLISQDHMNNKSLTSLTIMLGIMLERPISSISGNESARLSWAATRKEALCSDTVTIPDIAALSFRQSPSVDWNAFPWDMVVFKPQIPNQQQLQAQLQQQQPQQQPAYKCNKTQQQHPQLQQQQQPLPVGQLHQQPLMQIQQQQQIPQLQQQQQQQQMGTGMNQAYIQGGGRPQMLSQGQASSQGSTSMPGGAFIS